MAVVQKANPAAAFNLKSAALTLVSVVLKTPDLERLASELESRIGHAPELFDNDPVVADLSALRDEPQALDVPALVTLLGRYKMRLVAVRGASAAQLRAARDAGLGEAPEGVGAGAGPAPAAPGAAPTLVVDRPLRSGQQVYARGDLVVLGVVSFGAEVIADGHIHVYAPLRGRAVAGARGNTEARIFATCMQPQLVSIAGVYRTTETELPADVLGRPAQVRLDGERLVVEPLTA